VKNRPVERRVGYFVKKKKKAVECYSRFFLDKGGGGAKKILEKTAEKRRGEPKPL